MFWVLFRFSMKAITLHQPLASLTAIGVKTIEARSSFTDYRGPLAIHASKTATRVDDPYYRSVLQSAGLPYDRLPLGFVLATCELVNCEKISPATIPCYPEYAFGDFNPGWYAWKLQDIRALSEPIPARGHRGLWIWNS
jgi:hypothetical protein